LTKGGGGKNSEGERGPLTSAKGGIKVDGAPPQKKKGERWDKKGIKLFIARKAGKPGVGGARKGKEIPLTQAKIKCANTRQKRREGRKGEIKKYAKPEKKRKIHRQPGGTKEGQEKSVIVGQKKKRLAPGGRGTKEILLQDVKKEI